MVNEKVEEKVTPELPPPPQPPEYFPGFQRQVQAFAELQVRAGQRVEAAKKRMTELQSQWGLRMAWQAPNREAVTFPVFPFVYAQHLSEEDFIRQRQEAQTELDFATQEYSRFSWRFKMVTGLPAALADDKSNIRTAHDVLGALPNEFLLEVDTRWLEDTVNKLSYLVPPELPEEFQGDAGKVRENILNQILAEPKLELRGVHNLTVDELTKSFRMGVAELPPGMTTADVRSIMGDLEFDKETQEEIEGLHSSVEEWQNDWKIESAFIRLARAGLVTPEAPELTPWEFTKMLATQPALASLETLEFYFNALPRPLAAAAIINFPRIRKDSDAAELDRLYNQYKDEGMDRWEAYSQAYQDWGTNTWLKMFYEIPFDPTSYIGLGIATKLFKPIPYIGKFVGATERAWIELWDIPFRGARKLVHAIPKTPGQRAVSVAKQAFLDSRAFLRRQTGKDLVGLTAPEVKESMEFAIKQAVDMPWETGNMAVRVGRYLTDYDFIEKATASDWLKKLGVKADDITQQVVNDINYQFDLFYRKTYTSQEVSANILSLVGKEATEDSVGTLAKTLERYSEKLISNAIDSVKGDTAKEVLNGIFRNTEDLNTRKAYSAVYDFAMKSGRATSWMTRVTDKLVRNNIAQAVDRHVTAPMANQYLLFSNYGPFNVLENSMRSFLGGGEVFYPKASSPVDELVRIGEGLTNLPYEFAVAQRGLGRLEMAVIDPKTNKTMVFSRGKIPGITKELPVGFKLKIGTTEYNIRCLQHMNDMYGDIGTKQRAHYLTTKYKQFLSEVAPDETTAISKVFDDNQQMLEGIGYFNRREKNDLVRVLQQDATVGPDMIRKHDVPLPDVERRKALLEVNKTLDRCTDIYSPQKQTIRDDVLDGRMWKDIDGRLEAIGESIKEFNIVGMRAEARVLDGLVKDMAEFAPQNSDELLRTMGFISDIVDGISERISDVRQLTRSRAAKLVGAEADDFHRASSELLAEFLGSSQGNIDNILANIRTAVRTGIPSKSYRFPLTGVEVVKEQWRLPKQRLAELYLSSAEGVTNRELLDEVSTDLVAKVRHEYERVKEPMFRNMESIIVDVESATSTHEKMIAFDSLIGELHGIADGTPDYVGTLLKVDNVLEGGVPTLDFFQTAKLEDVIKVARPGPMLSEGQLIRLDALTDGIKLRHANAVATRDLDRRIINEAVAATPRNKRDKVFWENLERKRSTDAWEPYWQQEEQLFEAVEDLKLGMSNSLGVEWAAPVVPPDVPGTLAPAHIAYLMGITGDDLNKALTKMGAMVTIRPKQKFVTWVRSRAKASASKVGKTPDDIGFTKEAIGDCYDQMFMNAGIDPAFVANEPLTPAMLQLEDVRQDLHRIAGIKAMPDSDYVKFKGYLNGVADGLEKTPMYKTETAKAKWFETKDSAMMKTRQQYELDFTDYDNRNMVDAAMRMTFPFWTYEAQRYFWLPRTFLRTPGTATGLGRYMEYSEQGYIPVPGTNMQFNPTRGTVFMGGFRRMMLRDFPEYYDAFPGMEIIDYISRMGFYPGIHVMLPIIATGALTGKPEWGEILPAWSKTGLNAARAVAPEQAGKVIDHLFPDRFRDYMTMLQLGGMGYDADEIWRKKKQNIKLTEEEEKLWLKAENKATGLKGMLFEQSGLFRLRPPEYTEFQEDIGKLIEEMTGVSTDVQDTIRRRYPVTGKRFSDYFKLDSLQQKIVYEQEAYERWQGVTTPLYPSSWQLEDVQVRDYYERVEAIYEDYRHVGVTDEQGNLVSPSIDELTAQWRRGEIGPDQWTSSRGNLLSEAVAASREMGKRDYPDVPKTLEEREARFIERNIPAPTYSPDQEIIYIYYDIKPELRWDWEAGRDTYDFDSYYAKIDAIIETLEGEYRQRFLDRIQYEWNDMEKLYWQISREYLRPYRLVRNLVLDQYTEEQRHAIRRYEVARGAERDAIRELIGPDGKKLVSHFNSEVREARQRLRMLDPELDAWTYFFGVTDTLLSTESKNLYPQLEKQYLKGGG